MSDKYQTFCNDEGVIMLIGPSKAMSGCIDVMVIRGPTRGVCISIPRDMIAGMIERLEDLGLSEQAGKVLADQDDPVEPMFPCKVLRYPHKGYCPICERDTGNIDFPEDHRGIKEVIRFIGKVIHPECVPTAQSWEDDHSLVPDRLKFIMHGKGKFEPLVRENDPVLYDEDGEPLGRADVTQFPETGTRCSACQGLQYQTPHGPCCTNGHGGAEPMEED